MPNMMHTDEMSIDLPLVRRLLAAQFPKWADLPMEAVRSNGTDNAIYRLGEDMAMRMPRRPAASVQMEKEQLWLPRLAPYLPFAVPVPIANGTAAEGYPWPWSVSRWLEGRNPTADTIADPRRLAVDLARFIAALQKVDTTGGPRPGAHNFGRGVPLALRDGLTRTAITALSGVLDVAAVTAAWEADFRAPEWGDPPVWIHGDLCAGNLLFVEGRLSAVIDFGGLGVGDPACDLIVAWNLFSTEVRNVYRAALSVDRATWARGRAWALSVALVQLPYYRSTNAAIAANAKETIDAVLTAHGLAS